MVPLLTNLTSYLSNRIHRVQVRDLMVFIEARQTVRDAGELEGGDVLPVAASPSPDRQGKRGQRARKRA